MGAKTIRIPSEKQYRFAAKLLGEKDWTALSGSYRDRLDTLKRELPLFLAQYDASDDTDFASIARQHGPVEDVKDMSMMIDLLMNLPRSESAPKNPNRLEASDFPNVISGRYAVPTEDGHLAFYKVNVPDHKSRWHGRIFVDVMASDINHSVRGAAAKTVLDKIAADPKGAAQTYGQEIGVCSVCGRTLTDEESRAYGIGPICRNSF